MKIFRGIVGVILGIVAFFVAFVLCSIFINLLGQVPILRTLLFYPSDAGWALVVIPPVVAELAAFGVSGFVSNSLVSVFIVAAIIILLWIFVLIGMFLGHNFRYDNFMLYCIGIATPILLTRLK